MLPVLSREVVEGKQRVAILDQALDSLVVFDAPAGGLSASTIGRLKEAWSDEHTRWSKRDLSAKRYVYVWVDGIHVQARLEEAAQCLLVIIGGRAASAVGCTRPPMS